MMRSRPPVGLALALAAAPLLLAPPAPLAAQRTDRIVGGAEATPGDWPWQVVVFAAGFQCGGSLVASTWVLTAAHCVVDSDGTTPLPPSSVSGYAGIHDLTETSGAQLLDVVQVIVHESYDDVTSDNDVALLRLGTPLVPGPLVQPVPLVPSDVGPLTGELAWVTGWGATMYQGPTSDVLLEVDVPILSNSDCEELFDTMEVEDDWTTENMLCAGYDVGGKDSCQGDSGGPLVVDRSNTESWELAGVVSWGIDCATALPGVYTRVSRYVGWIESHTGPLPGSGVVFVDGFESGSTSAWSAAIGGL